MCQKAEVESNYLSMVDASLRKKGYEAFLAGQPISDCTEPDHPLEQYSHKHQWELGWNTAQSGAALW